MKLVPISPRKTPMPTTRRAALRPRTKYPTLKVVPLYRSPLAKLAWIFGLRP